MKTSAKNLRHALSELDGPSAARLERQRQRVVAMEAAWLAEQASNHRWLGFRLLSVVGAWLRELFSRVSPLKGGLVLVGALGAVVLYLRLSQPSSPTRAGLPHPVEAAPQAALQKAAPELGSASKVVNQAEPQPASAARVALSVQLAGTPLSTGQSLSAAKRELKIDFARAGELALQPETRATVTDVSEDSFGLRLERGHLNATITPGLGYHFRILAGAFEVRVVGTVFSVDWQPQRASVTVGVSRGKVTVTDLRNGHQSTVSAGQSLTQVADERALPSSAQRSSADARKLSHADLTQRAETQASDSQRSETQRSETQRQETEPAAVLPRASSAPVEHEPAATAEWKALAEAGEYQSAYAAAKKYGVSKLRSESASSELLLLADSARLSGAMEDAKQTLLSLRERYPADSNACVAGFALGRIAFEQHRDAEAASWLRGYLIERPNGPLSEGARSRLLTIMTRTSDRAALRAVAADYLKHHPTGPRASEATQVLGE